MRRKIVFLTGTRADFGKIKSLIKICRESDLFEVCIFATGMHMHHKYGYTLKEIEKSGFDNIYKFINYTSETTMDLTLAKTVEGFSSYCQEERPDLIVVHGDRVEALAGSIVGALNNILVSHIEGGEVSGTIDELIRHSVSKLSHIHFVSNDSAKKRLIQMGEKVDSIYVIGSPDVDIMLSNSLPTLESVKDYYEISFEEYAVVLFHPVTTEVSEMDNYAKEFVSALIESNQQFVVIYPNNDMGSNAILKEYKRLDNNSKIKVFPSIRFESFLVLMENAKFIIGNSSAGIREAPYYGLPAINVGTRQQNRALNGDIIHTSYSKLEILEGIDRAMNLKIEKFDLFGVGDSSGLFIEALKDEKFWNINKQKFFYDF